MTDDSQPDPELRAALRTLLDDEPAAPPVVDDLRRGRARRRRRRTRAGALVGIAAVTVGVVAVGATMLPGRSATSSEPAPPAAGSSAPDAAIAMADRLRPVLASMGRSVVEAGSTAGRDGTEIRLTVARIDHPEVVSGLWILGAVDDVRPVTHLARCTDASCPGDQVMTIADGVTATGGYEERGATSLTLDPPGAGARMLDRSFPTGSLVEVVSVPPRGTASTPSPSPDRPASLLTFEQLRRLITAIGDPLVRPTPTESSSAPPGKALDVVRSRAEQYLAGRGWAVVDEHRPTISDGTGREELDLVVQRADGGPTEESSSLYVVIDRESSGAGHYASACTADTCDPGPPLLDCQFGGADASCARSLLPNTSVGPLDWGSLILDRPYRDGALVEVVVGPDPLRATDAPLGPTPILDDDETRALLAAIGNPFGALVPVSAVRPCRDGDVKLIPAVDPDSQRGRRSLVVEVHARNPQVRCTVTGTPELQLLGADDRPLPFTVVRDTVSPIAAVLVTQDRTPAARVLVSQPTCRSTDVARASSLRVTLPGESVSTLVEVPDGLTLEYCVGGSGDPGVTVTESPFLAVPPGGAPAP